MQYEKETKEKIIKDLKIEVLDAFIGSGYEESDRLQVAIHEVVDGWASGLYFNEALDFLSQFEAEDYRNLDSGLYEGVLEKDGFEKLVVVLVYCLAEQELYNDDLINELQDWENETEEGKQLMEKAKQELKAAD